MNHVKVRKPTKQELEELRTFELDVTENFFDTWSMEYAGAEDHLDETFEAGLIGVIEAPQNEKYKKFLFVIYGEISFYHLYAWVDGKLKVVRQDRDSVDTFFFKDADWTI